jgi:hypothetical protein
MSSDKYTLMEEGLLMCLRKDGDLSSGPISQKCPAIAIEAGIMLELFLKGFISRVENEQKEYFVICKEGTTGDDILDEAIAIMKDIKNATFEDWIKNLNGTLIFKVGIKGLQERIFDRLVAKGLVKKEKGMVYGFRYPFSNEAEINQLTQTLKNAILSDGNLSPRTLCLIGLFQALDKPFIYKLGNALDINRIFPDKTERDKARANLEKLLEAAVETEGADNAAATMSDSMRKTIVRRMIRVAILGMFNILFNL